MCLFFSTRLKENLYNVLKAAGGGFRRDMEQATDDNQGCCDARLCGESHVEWSVLVSYANLLYIEIETTTQYFCYVSDQYLMAGGHTAAQYSKAVASLHRAERIWLLTLNMANSDSFKCFKMSYLICSVWNDKRWLFRQWQSITILI